MAIINTAHTETSFNYSTVDESIVVTSTGSIVDDIEATAIDSSGRDQHITMDGFIYSSDDYNNIGIEVFGTYTTVLVNGLIQAETGIIFDDTYSNSLTIGSQGAIESFGETAALFVGDDSVTQFRLLNEGELTSDAVGGTVVIDFGGQDVINNIGTISGFTAIELYENVGEEFVENSGTITAGSSDISSAILSLASTVGVNIVNSGLITDAATNSLSNDYAMIWLDDRLGVTSDIDNTGTISGSGYVIHAADDQLVISNSGVIHGGLYARYAATVHNSGLWAGQASSAVTVFDLAGSSDIVTNARAGTIDGGLLLTSGGDTLTNAGNIDGAITLQGAGTGDTMTNSGEITGAVTLAGSKTTFTNSGTVTGAITFSGANSAFTDTGSVTGTVKLGATNTFVNHGQIYGNVIAGSTNAITNKGVIHGDVSLGAHDTLFVGSVTGAVNAKTNDLLEFSGAFGNQTINKFVAGAGATADVIQFATNDFSSFAKVQAAATQQAANVVIRLDASDSITLTGVTLSSLVASNFTFT